MSYTQSEMPFYMQGSQTGNIMYPQQTTAPASGGGTLSTYPSQSFDPNAVHQAWINAGATGNYAQYFENAKKASMSAPTVVGQGEGWLSPDELRAKTDALGGMEGYQYGGGGGGGGSASTSGSGVSTGGGLGLSSLGGQPGSGTGGSPSGLTSSQYQTGAPLSYNSPNGGVYGPNTGGGVPAGGQQGVLQMQQANPQSAMQQYQNTPGYQMLGNDQTNQYQQSPGYQYAVNEAMKQVQQGASSRGLLESGSAMRAMTDRAVGMAQQDYGNWWNRQNQLYGDYQNRLQGLAGGQTGSQNAMTTGQNLGAGTLQTGANLGSLFGNQGSAGMGGIINTGAAQSANMTNAGAQQAQVNQANQSTQLAGATLNNGLF